MDREPTYQRVLRASELTEGSRKGMVVKGRKIILANVGGKIHAVEDYCTHEGKPLADGKIEGGTVTCIHHSVKYDLSTGKVVDDRGYVGVEPIRVYEAKVEGDDVLIKVYW
jgi:nitrite reductase/ring-hydroxylating ferredoxin subunit